MQFKILEFLKIFENNTQFYKNYEIRDTHRKNHDKLFRNSFVTALNVAAEILLQPSVIRCLYECDRRTLR